MPQLIIRAAILIALCTTSAFAQVYKCEEGGRVQFQDRPCAGVSDSDQEVLDPGVKVGGVSVRNGLKERCTPRVLKGGPRARLSGRELVFVCGEVAGVTKSEVMELIPDGEFFPRQNTSYDIIQWSLDGGHTYRVEIDRRRDVVQAAVLFGYDPSLQQQAPLTKQEIARRNKREASRKALYDRIKGFCALEWPSNYRMQRYCFERQNEGYEQVHGTNIIPGLRSDVKAGCIQEWPDNYRMQAYCARQQMAAFRELHK